MLLAHDDVTTTASVDILVRDYGASEVIAIGDFIGALAVVLDAAGYKPRSAS